MSLILVVALLAVQSHGHTTSKHVPSAELVQAAHGQATREDAQAHAEQVQQLQAAHEEELRSVQQAAQQAQAEMQAANAAECSVIKEAHAADLNRLRALQDALPQQLMQLQSLEPRHSSDLSPSELGACQTKPWSAAYWKHVGIHSGVTWPV